MFRENVEDGALSVAHVLKTSWWTLRLSIASLGITIVCLGACIYLMFFRTSYGKVKATHIHVEPDEGATSGILVEFSKKNQNTKELSGVRVVMPGNTDAGDAQSGIHVRGGQYGLITQANGESAILIDEPSLDAIAVQGTLTDTQHTLVLNGTPLLPTTTASQST